MKNHQVQLLKKFILTFVGVISDCANSTKHADDRPVYLADIASAAQWLVDMDRGTRPEDVAAVICSDKTSKDFGDYWRQGEWGEREAAAFKELRGRVNSLIEQS
ncbi:MAG: hypothetical protein HY204_10265 [Nitrospirae bacterium]|nr:hypothetical protein [Nitrospirota bacterium]